MKIKPLFFVLFTLAFSGCGVGFIGQTQIGDNIAPIQVGNCGANQYPNEPCVTVTVCSPGTTNCVTIPNVVLDTGSYGLRVFSNLVSVPLKQVVDSSGRPLVECSPFAQGTADWGPVNVADVVIAGEKAPSVPIQLINAGFASIPVDQNKQSLCANPDTSASADGYNGILGVGPSIQDCGADCVAAGNDIYFSCSGKNCVTVGAPLSEQVSNPVAFMPYDNNGVTLSFSQIPSAGASSTTGLLMLGIGTQPNNTASAVTVLPTDNTGTFTTQYNGQAFTSSFIDSGSNGIFFPTTVTACPTGGTSDGFLCPTGLTTVNAVQIAANSRATKAVTFQVANALQLLTSNLNAFNDLGGVSTADVQNNIPASFDYGLPYFFGKTIYFAIEGRSTPLGTGPFYAY